MSRSWSRGGFHYAGSADPVHYDYAGPGAEDHRGLDVLVHTVAEGYYALLAVPPPAPLHQALDALATAAAALRREMR